MKALVLKGNRRLKYTEVPDPLIQPDECLVAVKCAGICNSDIFRAYNKGAYFYPLIMGHEFSGVVVKTGRKVRGVKCGSRVAVFPLLPCHKCLYCRSHAFAQCLNYDYYGSRRQGAFAEFVAVKPWNLFMLPDSISFASSALLEPVAVAMHALRKVQLTDSDQIVILGAGLIGLAMAEYLSRRITAKNIFLVDRNDHKLALAKKFGVQAVNSTQCPNWPQIFEKAGGMDVVFEASGSVDLYRHSLRIVKTKGRTIWVGNIHGDLLLEKKLVSSLLRREINVQGCWNSSFLHDPKDDWHYALKYLKDAALVNSPLFRQAALKDGSEIFKKLYEQKNRLSGVNMEPVLKVLFEVGRQ